MAGAQWLLVPITLALHNLIIPHVAGCSWDGCASVSLFLCASMLIASAVDEQAVHGMFLADASDPASGRTSRRIMRGFHWILGFPLMVAMSRISDSKLFDGSVPETSEFKLLLSFVFLALTYFAAVFCFSCSESRHRKGNQSGLGPFAASVAPAALYLLYVAYVTVRLSASLLPLIVTTEAGMLISLPVLHGLVITRLQSAAHGPPPGRFATSRQGILSWPLVGYALCLLGFLKLAPPRTVAVLVALAPKRMLQVIQGLLEPDSPLLDVTKMMVENAQALMHQELQFSVRDLLAIGLGVALLVVHLGGRGQGSAKASEAAAVARRRLTKLRAASKLFPPPYPNGWYHLCNSDDIPEGRALAASACNKEFAVFRDENGRVAVLHAFCPHLGTHLGHGGTVENGKVVCPYHSWTFDKDGKCTDIPYCSKKPGEKTHTKAFISRERLGMVFVWLHADGLEPTYELTILDEIEEKGMQYVTDVPVENWQMHNMEASQNAADTYHFNTVHRWLSADDMHGRNGWLWVRHECKSRLALLGADLPETVISLDEHCAEIWLFGLIPLPKFLHSHFSSGAMFQGPQVSVFRVDTKVLGSCRFVFTFTPEAPFEQRCTVRVFRTWTFPSFLAAMFGRAAVKTVNQDREVWEHKLSVAPRNVVAGDGPFAAYGTWLRQFYSESSQSWGDISLEW